MDIDVSAIGYSFAGSVDEGKVQTSNQVLWDAHLNRAGLAQHWHYKESPQNNSLHYKTIREHEYIREMRKGYTPTTIGRNKGQSLCYVYDTI